MVDDPSQLQLQYPEAVSLFGDTAGEIEWNEAKKRKSSQVVCGMENSIPDRIGRTGMRMNPVCPVCYAMHLKVTSFYFPGCKRRNEYSTLQYSTVQYLEIINLLLLLF